MIHTKLTDELILKRLCIEQYDFNYQNILSLDIIISECLLNEFGYATNENIIKDSILYNNSRIYKLLNTGSDTLLSIYNIINLNLSDVMKLGQYKILLSHIIFYSIVESFFIPFDVKNTKIFYIDTYTYKYKVFNNFVKNIDIFYIILDKIGFNKYIQKKNKILWFFINLFLKNGLLITKKISVNNKTLVFYKLCNFEVFFKSKLIFNVCVPYTIKYNNNIFKIENCIYTIINIVKTNKNSNVKSQPNTSAVDISNSVKLHIDHNLLNIVISEFFLNFGIKSDSDKLKHANGIFLKEQIVTIQKIVSRVYKNNKCNNVSKATLLSKASKVLSTYIHIYQFIEFIEFSKYIKCNKFFLMHYVDFRGRLYSSSYLSPIYNKYLRNIYFYGYYTTEELNNLEVSLLYTTSYGIIQKYFYKINCIISIDARPILKQAVI
jgi:hypothetical protein